MVRFCLVALPVAGPLKGRYLVDAVSQSVHTAFRKLGYAADELLDGLVKSRGEAARAHQRGSAFDWKTAAENLEMSEDGLSFYLEPVKPAVRKATVGKVPMTIAEVDANTALHALQRLSRNTIKAFWVFLNMTHKGAQKLVIARRQKKTFEEAGLLASIAPINRAELRLLRKHLERDIADAEEIALMDFSRHPGEVARSKYGGGLLLRYWSDIGFDAELADPPKSAESAVVAGAPPAGEQQPHEVASKPSHEQQPRNANGSWLKRGLPPDGWHMTPLCGLLKQLAAWEKTTQVTLKAHNPKGVRWWIVSWGGKDDETGWRTPFAIYYPNVAKFTTANGRRRVEIDAKKREANERKAEETKAVRRKPPASSPASF